MDDKPLVSIVIPTYKRKKKLYRLIQSIQKSDYPQHKIEIIIVDDSSGEDYSDLQITFPNVTLIKNNTEKWVAESRNIGIRHSSGDYIFLIDDDNIIDRDCIHVLVDYLRSNEKFGIVAPIMYYYSKKNMIWCAGIKRNMYTSITHFIGAGDIDEGQFHSPIESEDFPNAFMVKRELIDEIGYFDNISFPIHYEEADFCIRARKTGYLLYCIPNAKIWHDISNISNSNMGFHLQNKDRIYFAGRNRVIFHVKYNSFLQKIIFFPIFLPAISFFYLIIILSSNHKKKIRFSLYYLKGTKKGLLWNDD